jgi:hypothetical protein
MPETTRCERIAQTLSALIERGACCDLAIVCLRFETRVNKAAPA